MNHNGSNIPAYGLWTLVIINSALFIMFAFSFAKPESKRDWKSLGAFSAFIVALFIGSGGSSGGMLNVRYVEIEAYHFYWSWPLFVIGTALSFGLFVMMD